MASVCRGFGDASLPPTIMVEGKDVSGQEVADNVSRTSSKSRIYTPGESEYLMVVTAYSVMCDVGSIIILVG